MAGNEDFSLLSHCVVRGLYLQGRMYIYPNSVLFLESLACKGDRKVIKLVTCLTRDGRPSVPDLRFEHEN